MTWLSLDEGDNDPARFLTYFIAAVQVIDEPFGKETLALLQSPEPPAPNILMTTLLNEFTAIAFPFVLAIDDYQVIQTHSIHDLLNFLIEHQPGQIHLVVVTREDPPLPLPRLRARGQVTEVRQEDLRFTTRECAEFLETVMKLQVAKSDVAALERRTEGWIAGLQLAAISMRGRDDLPGFIEEFTASNRYVLDYLMQEVFERQPTEVQYFLLKTSILDQVCASLCDAVTELSGSQAFLEMLEHNNLFIIPLDEQRTWYRYHPLFRDLLYKRLAIQGQATMYALHQRAGAWYENHNRLPDAIEHALAGTNWEKALALFHDASPPLINQGQVFTLLNWYNQVPGELLLASAETCLEFGWILLLSAQYERAGYYLSYAQDHAIDDPSFKGQLLNAQAYLARIQGDLGRMVALSQQALAILPKDDQYSRCIVSINLGNAYWYSGKMDAAEHALTEVLATGRATGNPYAVCMAQVFQGMALTVRGRLRDANEHFLNILQQEATSAFFRVVILTYLGVLHYEWNQLEQCGKYILESIRTYELVKNDEIMVLNWIMMARIYMAGGNPIAADEALEKAQQLALHGDVPADAVGRFASFRVLRAIACGDLAVASTWGDQMVDNCGWHPFSRFINTTPAQLLLAQGEKQAAAAYLERCFVQASQEGWKYAMITIRALQALAEQETGAALEYLKDALLWAQREGLLRTFADLGKDKEMKTLLHEAARRRIAPDYVEKILSETDDGCRKPIIGQLALAEPLNPRELEVQQLLASGLPNQKIAEKLVISIGTVKTHVHNICGKLGVNNRTEAAAQARKLGLV